MFKQVLYILTILLIIFSCEEIYTPDLDTSENYLFVEGRFLADQQINTLKLRKTLDFYSETRQYPVVPGANVTLVDDLGNLIVLEDLGDGNYQLDYILDKSRQYKILIEYEGKTFESTLQSIPETPALDTVYSRKETKISLGDGENSVEDIVSESGVQLYADLKNEGSLKHYWFSGKYVLQFIYYIDSVMYGEIVQFPVYCWKTLNPKGIYNIAGPPEFSTVDEIYKHPLSFFGDYKKLIADTQYFAGYIYQIDQYGITEENYNYYKDLNSQLEADNKIFDPVYVQAEGNIACTSDPGTVVLGNFEILSYIQHRYYLMYYNRSDNVTLKKIPYFYDIPSAGEIVELSPDFWETKGKVYP